MKFKRTLGSYACIVDGVLVCTVKRAMLGREKAWRAKAFGLGDNRERFAKTRKEACRKIIEQSKA